MQTSVAKKIFAVGVAASTVLMSLAPFAAQAAAHAEGTNIKSSDGTVWMVTGGQRRAYTSAGAFLSYGFNSWSSVVDANADDLALPTAGFIPPQDGKIICSDRGADKGTCYLVTGGQKAGFTSAAVFTGLGFSFARSQKGDVSWMTSTTNIDNTTAAHRPGVLVNNAGTVQLVGATGLLGIPDVATFNGWGYSFSDVVPANAADKAMSQTGVMAARTAGQLSPTATTGGSGTVVTSGPLSVSLASDTPSAQTLVAGQAVADLAHFTISGNGTLTSLKLNRIGVSDSNTLQNVYLYQGAVRLTDSATVSTDGTISFNSPAGLFTVNGSMTVAVKADIKTGTNGNTVGVSFTGYVASGSTTMVTVQGVQGNVMTIATPGTIASVNLGTNTVSSASINAGTMGYTVWSSPVTVSGRTGTLKSATFKFIGSATNDAITNVKLYVDGVAQGNSSSVNSNGFVVFDFNASPVSLTTGSHTVDVRADIIKGSNRNFYLQVQNSGDFLVYDSQLNIGIAATSPTSATTFSPNIAGTITVNTGTITVTLDPSFNAMTTVTGGGTNAVIGKFKVQAYGEDVKVQSLIVNPILTGTTPAATGLNNVALYYNGAQVGSSQNWTTTTSPLTYQLGSSLIAQAGTTGTLEVHADLQTPGNVNYTAGTVQVALNAGSANGQGQSSLNSTNVPASTIQTTGLTMTTGALSVAKNPSYLNQTVNPNTAAVKIGSFTLQNTSSSEGVRVTNLSVSLAFATTTYTNFSNLRTSEASGSGATPIAPAAGSPSVNNFSVNFTMAPGDTRTIDILADLSTGSSGTVIPTLTVTALGATSNVNVSPPAVVGQTITLASGSLNGTPTLQSSGSMVSQYVVGGSADVPVATYNFLASNGVATISELKFTVTAGAGGVTPIGSVKVNNISAPVVGGIAYLTGLNLTVPNNPSGLNVLVSPTYSVVGTGGEVGGATAQMALTYVKYTIGGTTTTISPSINSNTITLVGSKPKITIGNLNGSATPGTLGLGSTAIADITVSADAKGDIKLTQIPLVITPNGGNGGSLSITASTTTVTETNGAAISGVAAPAHATIANGTNGTANVVFSTPYTVAAGTSKTFRVTATIGGTIGTSASVTAQLGAAANFTWTDVNGAYNGTGTLLYDYSTTQSGKVQ